MAQHLIASSATLKTIRPGDPRRRLSDGAGLYLLLYVKGGAHGWRLDYTHRGKRKTISLGTFPEVGLSEARSKAAQARRMVRDGVDPSGVRKAERSVIKQDLAAERRAAAGLPPLDSFEAIAREWFERNSANWAPSHAEKILGRLVRDVFPWIGKVPVAGIGPTDLLSMLKRIEDRGAIETTHRVHQICGQIAHFSDRGHRFTLMADGAQRVRVPGFIVSQVSAMAGKPPELSTPARSAGVGNSAPKAMLA